MKSKIIYYTGAKGEDFCEFTDNIKPLSNNYKYINKNPFARFFSFIGYSIIMRPFAFCFLKIKYHQKIIGKKKIKDLKGYYIYSNHTMILGDACTPSLIDFRKKNFIIVGGQTKSLTPIMPLIRAVGGIPLPDTVSQYKEFLKTLKYLGNKGKTITIFPEAHVWPYYTGIREFDPVMFTYPVNDDKPVVVITNCYKKKKWLKSPRIVTFIDGPFYPKKELSKQENKEYLRNETYRIMCKRTKEESTYSFHTYIKKENAE